MDEKKYTIVLSDGTRLENLDLNGNNFISNKEISPGIFERNLDVVTISDGVRTEQHTNMELVQISQVENEWWFILREIPPEEIIIAKLRSDVDFLSMMTDINL